MFPSGVLAWAATVLLSAIFSVVFVWGAQNNWIISAVSASGFTFLSLMGAGFLDRRADQVKDAKASLTTNNSSLDFLRSVLAALGIISSGLAAFFVFVHLGNCGAGKSYTTTDISLGDIFGNGGKWTVDTASLPAEVADWANDKESKKGAAEFAYLPAEDMVMFTGRNEDDDIPRLWMKPHDGQVAPQSLSDITCPTDFVVLGDGMTVCLTAADVVSIDGTGGQTCDRATKGFLTCTTPDGHHSILHAANPRSLLVDKTVEGRIWYKTDPPASGVYKHRATSESLVYSADVGSFLTETLHSYQDDSSSEVSVCVQKAVGASSIFSALLVVVLSVFVYWKRGIPSMPVCMYIGLTGVVLSVYYIVNPLHGDGIRNMLAWWLTVSSLGCAVVLGYQWKGTNEGTRDWGMNFAGLFFFVGCMMVTQIFSDVGGSFWRCFVLTLVCFVPLLFVGNKLSLQFLVVLSMVGMLFNVWMLMENLSGIMDERIASAVQFFALATAGLGIGRIVPYLCEKEMGMECLQIILCTKRGKSNGEATKEDTSAEKGEWA